MRYRSRKTRGRKSTGRRRGRPGSRRRTRSKSVRPLRIGYRF